MHHLGIGAAHTGKRVLALADDNQVTVIELTPARSSQPTSSNPTRPTGATNNKEPGRWPSSQT